MAMAFVETVQRYAAFLYPHSGRKGGRINLYCHSHRLYLIFTDPSQSSQSNTFNESIKTGVAYQTFDAYAEYLDLVRNEGPISVTFRPEDTPPTFVVYAASEAPGEGEM
jgi:hypothetical protein